ncbi:MAG: hypothetical protein EXX96DRAFT_645536 [Benjaminiella poitrasii]|nr:MAG: hypothetical protein EXX96DRAFT_645536 [Benjaminiella poitrasii]
MEYGLAILTLNTSLYKQLEKTQDDCLRIIFGASPIASTKVMDHLVHLPTMKQRSLILQAKFVVWFSALPADALLTCLLPCNTANFCPVAVLLYLWLPSYESLCTLLSVVGLSDGACVDFPEILLDRVYVLNQLPGRKPSSSSARPLAISFWADHWTAILQLLLEIDLICHPDSDFVDAAMNASDFHLESILTDHLSFINSYLSCIGETYYFPLNDEHHKSVNEFDVDGSKIKAAVQEKKDDEYEQVNVNEWRFVAVTNGKFYNTITKGVH